MSRARPADLPLSPPRVTLRWAEVVEGYISAQFFTEHGDGAHTHAGTLSMTVEEWHTGAWRAVRQAVAACYENTTGLLPNHLPLRAD